MAKKSAERFGFPTLADYLHAKILAESNQEAEGRLKLAAELDVSQMAHLETARTLQRVAKEKDSLALELAAVEGRMGALLGILKEHCPPQILARLPLENLRRQIP